MPELALGLDAGGTKTEVVLCDRAGAVRGFGVAGRGNWEYDGLEPAAASLGGAVEAALASAGARPEDVSTAVFALAGLDWPIDVEKLEPIIVALGLGGPHVLVNDAFAALRAGCRARHGAVSIAGTGSVTAARNRAGETFRTMAIGYGERGGGSDLVREGLDAIARARHGQTPPTLLEERFLAALGFGSTDALYEAITRHGLAPSSQLAPLVLAAAADGDPAAIAIAHEMGASLAASVAGVARILAMQDDVFEVVCAGGVHRARSRTLDAAFRGGLAASCPGALRVELAAPPAIGAALLALDQVGAVTPAVHDRLLAGFTAAGVA